MSLPKDKAWFLTKRYGYGWGLPVRWQGWALLIAYTLTLTLGAIFLAGGNPPLFLAFTLAFSAALVAVCLWKGESPRWRWGGK
ncbi:MAG: hypothetical protein V4675_03710 [Verrucomicrobiota bacterium]